MSVGYIVYAVWAVLVGVWWIITDPESAPQQAALAGQALVLIAVPYTILASIQRAMAAETQQDISAKSKTSPQDDASGPQDEDSWVGL